MGQAKRRGTFEERQLEGLKKRKIDAAIRVLKMHPAWKGASDEQRIAAVAKQVAIWEETIPMQLVDAPAPMAVVEAPTLSKDVAVLE